MLVIPKATGLHGGGSRQRGGNEVEWRAVRSPNALLHEGVLTVFDLKVFAPIGSDAGEVELRGGFVVNTFPCVANRLRKA